MPTTRPRPDPRALGEARLAVAREARTPEAWARRWREPEHPYPFRWGTCWRQCVQYQVEDYAAEVGFFLDVLGLKAHAFGDDFSMFTSPDQGFFLAVVPARPPAEATPPDTLRLQFMIEDLEGTVRELERRGIALEKPPTPWQDGSPLSQAVFRTPHGVAVDLWGLAQPTDEAAPTA